MQQMIVMYILFYVPATTYIYTLPYTTLFRSRFSCPHDRCRIRGQAHGVQETRSFHRGGRGDRGRHSRRTRGRDRKSTRLNSSHVEISYAVFCLKKKKNRIC